MSTTKKKRVIKDKVELEKIIDYYLRNDLSLAVLESHYDLTYPQREFLLKKTMGYSRQQDILVEEYNTTDVASTYLEIPHEMKEEYPLEAEEQIRLFKRLDEIDTEHIGRRLFETNDELSKVLTKFGRIMDKYGKEVKLFNQYRREYPDVALADILKQNGEKTTKIEKLCEMYANYQECNSQRKKLTKERDNLLKERRTLLDNNYEYASIIEKLTTTNVKLANWVVREFFRNVPLPKDEAQALALEGLGKAINRFDYTRGNTFSTFATKMMMTNIMRRFKDIMGVSWLNYWMKRNIAYWREELASYDTERKTPYTAQELADSGLVKYTIAQIENMDKSIDIIYNFSDYYDIPENPYYSMLGVQDDFDEDDDMEDVYLEEDEEADITLFNDMPVTQEDYDFIDALEDMMDAPVDQYETERELYLPFLKEALYKVLGELTEREQKILIYRFGLEDGQDRTLEEVGKIFFLSRDRIRQIEAKALRRLRHPSRKAKLIDYLEEDIMPRYTPPCATTAECVEAFMRLYDLRNSKLPYSAKAFFLSKRSLELDEEKARNLDLLMDIFIVNMSLDYKYRFQVRDIIDEFVEIFGSNYSYKYPYVDIYRALEEKISDDEKRKFSEDEQKKIAEEKENIIKLVLNNNC